MCYCSCLAAVSCMTTSPDLGDHRLFTPAFQVEGAGVDSDVRGAELRSAQNTSHFTLPLMSPGKWRGARTGRWCLQMRAPRTTSNPDTRCWFDYAVACKVVRMHAAGEVMHSQLIKWNRNDWRIYLAYFCPNRRGGVFWDRWRLLIPFKCFQAEVLVCLLLFFFSLFSCRYVFVCVGAHSMFWIWICGVFKLWLLCCRCCLLCSDRHMFTCSVK